MPQRLIAKTDFPPHKATGISGVYLTRRDPAKRTARFYRVFIHPNLWGE